MKHIVFITFVLFCSLVNAQNPKQFDKNAMTASSNPPSFEIIIPTEAQPVRYAKSKITFTNIKWDVRKSDSLLTPVSAIVTGNLDARHTGQYTSEQEAMSAQFDPRFSDTSKFELIYIPHEKGWIFSAGRIYSKPLRGWSEITQPKGPLKQLIDSFAIEK